jgi:hypothetical protein
MKRMTSPITKTTALVPPIITSIVKIFCQTVVNGRTSSNPTLNIVMTTM